MSSGHIGERELHYVFHLRDPGLREVAVRAALGSGHKGERELHCVFSSE